jgi:hypothetical protein
MLFVLDLIGGAALVVALTFGILSVHHGIKQIDGK